jgi:hypothetical protein
MDAIVITFIVIGSVSSVVAVSCYMYKTYRKKNENISKDSLINYADIYPMDRKDDFSLTSSRDNDTETIYL